MYLKRKRICIITNKKNRILKAKLSKGNINIKLLKRKIKLRLISKIGVSELDPNYITGLTQSDGSFFVSISKGAKYKWGLRIRPSFTITQKHLITKSVLESVRHYFNCGRVHYNAKRDCWEYVADSRPDLLNIIFKHFEKYPLHGSKQRACHAVKLITEMLEREDHHDKSENKLGFMIKLIFKINTVTNRSEDDERALFAFLKMNYIEDKDFKWTYVNKDYPINDQFLMGLIEGDGSFFISFHPDLVMRPGFNITQHRLEKDMLEKVRVYLNCGGVKDDSETIIKYRIDSIKEISNHLIPFVDDYQLFTKKR